MSRWNHPMRKYVAAKLVCTACDRLITGETKMARGLLFHPVCLPRWERANRPDEPQS
jgi:hypothetical protein